MYLLLVGITLGEIGPKLGQNTLNNGYLLFDHVKVPRENMLMRNARVQEVSTGGRRQRDRRVDRGSRISCKVGEQE